VFLRLDLEDLSSVKKSAEEFLAKKERLDVLFNNADVNNPPSNQKSKQGYEMQLGVNTLAPYLFTTLLTPSLVRTTKTTPCGWTRVVWISSPAAYLFSTPGGLDVTKLDYKKELPRSYKCEQGRKCSP